MPRRYRPGTALEPRPPILDSRCTCAWLGQSQAVYQVTQESKSLVTCVHPSTTMLRVERLLIGFVSYLGLQQPCGPKEALGIHSE